MNPVKGHVNVWSIRLSTDPLSTLAIAAASSAVTTIKPEVKPPTEVSNIGLSTPYFHNLKLIMSTLLNFGKNCLNHQY